MPVYFHTISAATIWWELDVFAWHDGTENAVVQWLLYSRPHKESRVEEVASVTDTTTPAVWGQRSDTQHPATLLTAKQHSPCSNNTISPCLTLSGRVPKTYHLGKLPLRATVLASKSLKHPTFDKVKSILCEFLDWETESDRNWLTWLIGQGHLCKSG